MNKKLLSLLSAILTCCLTLTSCSNDDRPSGGHAQDDTPIQPSQQKRVSQTTTYIKNGEGYEKYEANQCTYDSQGRLKEWKLLTCDDDGEFLKTWVELSYSDSQIHTIVRTFSVTDDAPNLIDESYYDLDNEGRVVKETLYSYFDGESRPAEPSVFKTMEYDGLGHLIRYTYDNHSEMVYEWQGDDLHKVTSYNEQGVSELVRTYEYSEVSAAQVIPINFQSCYNWLFASGFYGKSTRFLPASVKHDLYSVDGTLVSTLDNQFTYDTTDGRVTTIYELEENRMHSLDISYKREYMSVIEW